MRIPREFELPGKQALVRKEGERLIVEPIKPKGSLAEYLATLEPLDEAPLVIEELPLEPFEL